MRNDSIKLSEVYEFIKGNIILTKDHHEHEI